MSDTLTSRLRELIRDGAAPDDAAATVVAEMAPEAMAEMLQPLVALRARALARAQTRRVEHQVFVEAGGHVRMTVREELHRLVRETFIVPSTGAVVRWGEATPAQHRDRATWLRQHAADVIVAAERHEEAARLIEAEKVETLNELLAAPAEGAA